MCGSVLLDPPGNLTLKRTAKPGQLKLYWEQPVFIDGDLQYEISYAVTGNHMGKVSHKACAPRIQGPVVSKTCPDNEEFGEKRISLLGG